jgi:DNA polymerase-3 subunit delta'
LDTVRSRILKLEFTEYEQKEVKEVLLRTCDNSNIDFFVSYCNGNIGRALAISNDSIFIKMREKVIKIILDLNDNTYDSYHLSLSILEEYKEKIEDVFDILYTFFRDILVIKTGVNQKTLINSDKKDIMIENSNRFSKVKILNCLEAIDKIRSELSQNTNFSLAMEYMMIKFNEG